MSAIPVCSLTNSPVFLFEIVHIGQSIHATIAYAFTAQCLQDCWYLYRVKGLFVLYESHTEVFSGFLDEIIDKMKVVYCGVSFSESCLLSWLIIDQLKCDSFSISDEFCECFL